MKKGLADLIEYNRYISEIPFPYQNLVEGDSKDPDIILALVWDWLQNLGFEHNFFPLQKALNKIKKVEKIKSTLGTLALAIYLLKHPSLEGEFRQIKKGDLFLQSEFSNQIQTLFLQDLITLSEMAHPFDCLKDPERGEEFIRVILKGFGFRPGGETEVFAKDRLQTISLFERKKLLEAAKSAELRRETLRKELEKKARKEAAAKVTRE